MRLHLLLPIVATAISPPTVGAESFRIGVEVDAIYAVSFDALRRAGLAAPVPSSRLALSSAGEAVPMQIVDGGDGELGPGDSLRFLGRHLAGEHSYFNEHSPHNVYRLTVGPGVEPDPVALRATGVDSRPAFARAVRRIEPQNLMVRFPAQGTGDQPPAAPRHELWYWAALDHARGPLSLSVDLPGFAGSAADVELRIGLKGWSNAASAAGASDLSDHVVEAWAGDERLGSVAWDGLASSELAIQGVPQEALREGALDLSLRVPERRAGAAGDPLVDASLLNWIEVHYRLGALPAGQFRVEIPTGGPLPWSPAGAALLRFAADGAPVAEGKEVEHALIFVADTASVAEPIFVERTAESERPPIARRCDYIVITHPTLRDAVGPLVDFHRGRGLAVEVFDTTEIYDAYAHGVATPRAIKEFLRAAFEGWSPPPRFVLLVGDASWDGRSETASEAVYVLRTLDSRLPNRLRNPRRPGYGSDVTPQGRNLLPTWRVAGPEGHYASDGWFVSFDPASPAPHLALGRIPTVTPTETRQVVDKILRASLASAVGPWRRRVFWITNQVPSFQTQTRQAIGRTLDLGFDSPRHFPDPELDASEADRRSLRDAFDRGNFAVLFFGHGGRFIWRTGPLDLENNRDLFTLDDLDLLEPTATPPIVLSMTCFSAPFDHPTADSIGEKLLRLADRGASATIASSWRTIPHSSHNDRLLRALVESPTVGEALQEAKRRFGNWHFSTQYNLLGDPAMPVRYPDRSLVLELEPGERPSLRVHLPPELEDAELLVTWIDPEGVERATVQIRPRGVEVSVELPDGIDEAVDIAAVTAYAWDAARGRDAVGAASWQWTAP